eukprot:3420713-Amphidinium_carterae.1
MLCSSTVVLVLKRDETVLARDGLPLEMDLHERVLARVGQGGLALAGVPVGFGGNRHYREIVLAAVRQKGQALESAAEGCRGDREIVLAAVQQDGLALQLAAE